MSPSAVVDASVSPASVLADQFDFPSHNINYFKSNTMSDDENSHEILHSYNHKKTSSFHQNLSSFVYLLAGAVITDSTV